MKTLIKTQTKLDLVSVRNNNYGHLKANLTDSKTNLNFKLYQKTFLLCIIFFTIFLFPESPKDFEKICNKYNSPKVCNVW